MTEDHLAEKFLESIYSGKSPPERLVGRMVRHLTNVCPECNQAATNFAQKYHGKHFKKLFDFTILLRTVEGWNERLVALRREAERDLKDLLAMPAEDRLSRIARATKRFRSPLLGELLLAKCRSKFFDHPREAFALAELAHQVALQVNAQEYGISLVQDILIRAHAYKANAMRVRGKLSAASDLIGWPLSGLENNPDPLVRGEVLEIAASIRRDQQDFPEALGLFGEALELYREISTMRETARVLVSVGEVFRLRGDPENGLVAVRHALDHLKEDQDSRLHLCARHNLALYLAEAGHFLDSAKEFEANRSLYDSILGDRAMQILRRWLEGKIVGGLGDSAEAEQAFLDAKQGFIELELALDAALVSLDLALVYIEQADVGKIKHLAQEMVFIFKAHQIHREALVAVTMFQAAATAEEVSVSLVRNVARRLELLRINPAAIPNGEDPSFE